MDRPIAILTILKALRSGEDAIITDELEVYIADLEARRPDRPIRIMEILTTLRSHYPAEMSEALELYIADLEVNQQIAYLRNISTSSNGSDQVPVWSHQRSVERAQRRQERVLKRQNDYQ